MSFGSSQQRVSIRDSIAISVDPDSSTNPKPWILDQEPSMEVLKAAWDRGLTTFDTANIYSNGESERIIGKFLKKARRCSFEPRKIHDG
jgi:aryl-alcohol dehydrogenase-like predicted oxidoreductase